MSCIIATHLVALQAAGPSRVALKLYIGASIRLVTDDDGAEAACMSMVGLPPLMVKWHATVHFSITC